MPGQGAGAASVHGYTGTRVHWYTTERGGRATKGSDDESGDEAGAGEARRGATDHVNSESSRPDSLHYDAVSSLNCSHAFINN